MDYYSNAGGVWTNYYGRQTKSIVFINIEPARVKLVKEAVQKK
jgi:hypothetical protein